MGVGEYVMDWEQIRNEWETTKITLKDLAAKHDVKMGTLKSRKSREKWSRDPTKKDATKIEKVATQKQLNETKKKERYEPIVEGEELTDKQRLFCIYYIKYFNATKAYQKAYECAYSTAMVNGHGLLRNTKISAHIDQLKAEQTNELKLNVRDVLQKYIDIAFADITDYVTFGRREIAQKDTDTGEPLTNQNGESMMEYVSYVDLVDSENVDGTILTEVKQGREGISVKLADKMKALDMLTKYFDLLSENNQKRLKEEKMKMDIKKAEAEVEKLSDSQGDGSVEIVITRKGDNL